MARTRKGKRNVKSKVPVQECLKCSEAAIKRGLCQTHYNQFDWDRNVAAKGLEGKKRERAKERYDDAEVAAGRILASRPGNRRRETPLDNKTKTKSA